VLGWSNHLSITERTYAGEKSAARLGTNESPIYFVVLYTTAAAV
jgi:hypothetical protein